MTIWSELCTVMRWLLRRPEPPPPPGTGQRYQEAEQAAARQRLLDHAAQLRRSQGNCEPAQDVPADHLSGHGPGEPPVNPAWLVRPVDSEQPARLVRRVPLGHCADSRPAASEAGAGDSRGTRPRARRHVRRLPGVVVAAGTVPVLAGGLAGRTARSPPGSSRWAVSTHGPVRKI